MAAGQMCDGPHIYRRGAGLGFNPRKVLWGDFARISAAQTPFRHERSKPKAYKPCRASQISDRSILSRTDPCDRDFVTRFHRRWPGQLWWLPAASSRRSTSALLWPMPRPTGQWPRATSSRRRLAMTMPSSISGRSTRRASGARAATRTRSLVLARHRSGPRPRHADRRRPLCQRARRDEGQCEGL